jgi:exodeoxyribonuclease VII small subunit
MAKKDSDYRTLSEDLDTLLATLQRSDIHVDEAMKLYQQGLGLVKQLEERLEQAENELVTLKVHTPASSDQDS